jgi:hypothetical protein
MCWRGENAKDRNKTRNKACAAALALRNSSDMPGITNKP